MENVILLMFNGDKPSEQTIASIQAIVSSHCHARIVEAGTFCEAEIAAALMAARSKDPKKVVKIGVKDEEKMLRADYEKDQALIFLGNFWRDLFSLNCSESTFKDQVLARIVDARTLRNIRPEDADCLLNALKIIQENKSFPVDTLQEYNITTKRLGLIKKAYKIVMDI